MKKLFLVRIGDILLLKNCKYLSFFSKILVTLAIQVHSHLVYPKFMLVYFILHFNFFKVFLFPQFNLFPL